MIPVRMLLKSWAMPPASAPRDSSFSIFSSSFSCSLRSVISLVMPWNPVIVPSASRSGVELISAHNHLPSLHRCCASKVTDACLDSDSVQPPASAGLIFLSVAIPSSSNNSKTWLTDHFVGPVAAQSLVRRADIGKTILAVYLPDHIRCILRQQAVVSLALPQRLLVLLVLCNLSRQFFICLLQFDRLPRKAESSVRRSALPGY